MSDTPRMYSSRGGGFSFSRRRRIQRARRAVVAALAVAIAYSYWISRDTHPIAEFVEAGHAIEVVIPRANAARHRFIESRIWKSVPPEWAAGWPEAMADTHGLPEWVVGNLVGSGAIAVADDVSGWTDLVVASKMTRAGCVIERALRFMPSNSSEWAGGLRIRYWKPAALHYAVRGRTLLLSPSRGALVEALTVARENRVAPASVGNALADTGAEDARGTLTFSPDSAPGQVFSELRFAVRIEQGEASLRLRAKFRPEVADALAATWSGVEPVALPVPFNAPVSLSADLGASVEESWRTIAELVDVSWLTAEQWESWRESEPDSPAAMLTSVLGAMDTRLRLAWKGTDVNEMAPTPILVGSIEGSRDAAQAILDELPSNDGVRTADRRVFYERDTATVGAELMSGPSMSPTGRWEGDTLYFSTSAATANVFFAEGRRDTLPAPRPGNLYLRIRPADAMRELVEAGTDLARDGMLRGYTAEEFGQRSEAWIERAAALESAHLLSSLNNKQIEAEIYVKCAPAQ